MTSSKGTLFNAYVYIEKESGKLKMELPVRSEFMGVSFSSEQLKKFQAGEVVPVEGLRKKNGEIINANMLWNANEGRFCFEQKKNRKRTGR